MVDARWAKLVAKYSDGTSHGQHAASPHSGRMRSRAKPLPQPPPPTPPRHGEGSRSEPPPPAQRAPTGGGRGGVVPAATRERIRPVPQQTSLAADHVVVVTFVLHFINTFCSCRPTR